MVEMAAMDPKLHGQTTEASTPFSVKGKTAIVTGAGSGTLLYSFLISPSPFPPKKSHNPHPSPYSPPPGINYCFASLLLSRGCNVVLADLSLRPEAQALLTTYPSSPRALFVKTDVTSWPALANLFTVAAKEFPTVDIVCPGAGIYDPPWSSFWHPPGSALSKDAPDAGHYASIDINLTHPIRATQLAISHFLATAKGQAKRVVITSSIAGQIGNLNTPLYVAAKHGINGFVRSLASLEGRTGIRVNAVAPGVIKTPLWMEAPEKLKFIKEGVDEWATPEEVSLPLSICLSLFSFPCLFRSSCFSAPGLGSRAVGQVMKVLIRNQGRRSDAQVSRRRRSSRRDDTGGWKGPDEEGAGVQRSGAEWKRAYSEQYHTELRGGVWVVRAGGVGEGGGGFVKERYGDTELRN